LRLVVRDLALSCRIGLYDRERGKPQRLLINLQAEVTPPAVYDDAIEGVVDYSQLLRRLRQQVERNDSLLLESLADRILTDIFSEPRILAVWIRIEKLDRYADLHGLGIELERRRPRP
jgi:dihydroneopterin aldolase